MSRLRTQSALLVAGLVAAVACSRDGSFRGPTFDHAQAALSNGPLSLVLDVNSVGASNPGSFTVVNGTAFFVATSSTSGTELWKTDGTAAGTTLVRDLNPGTGSSSPQLLTPFGNELVFVADDGTNGPSLWITDGTSAGTTLLARVATPASVAVAHGLIFFAGTSSANGGELWTSDGTPGGTAQLKDLNPGSASSQITSLTALGNAVFFCADDGTDGAELWTSDGTAAGTKLVKDLNPGSASSYPSSLTVAGSTLYFVADDGTHGVELWSSNGTTTQLTTDLNPGSGSSSPAYLTTVGTKLFFAANDGTNGLELWSSDGSTTQLVKDINPGAGGSSPAALTADKGWLYFTANDGTHGVELWKSDGTSGNTQLVKDINVGSGDGLPASATFVALPQGELLFPATNGSSGMELWKSDGFALGTNLVQDLDPGAAASNPRGWAQVNGLVLFAADDGSAGRELWSVAASSVTGPTIACPANVDAIAADSSGTVVNYPAAFATDAAGTPTLSYSQASGTAFPLGETTVTATAVDGAGATAQCSFIVTVASQSPAPTITCPPQATLEANNSAGASITAYPPVKVAGGTGATTVTYNPPVGSTLPMGSSFVVATVTDTVGNSAQCTFAVTVADTTPPQLTCPATQNIEATSTAGAVVTYAPATAHDAVTGSPTVTYSQPSGTAFPMGTTIVSVSAADAAGNSSSCTFKVIVQDTTPPALTCPSSVAVEATGPTGATVTYDPATATDAVTANPGITYSQASGTNFPVGVTTVKVTSTDAANNSASCTFKVTVRDTTPPSLTCPMSITTQVNAMNGATVTYPPATATDLVTASPRITYSLASGSLFPLGVTTVNVTAKDSAGNQATCSFTVTVQDSQPPQITCPSDVTTQAKYSTGTYVQVPPAVATDVLSTPTITYQPPITSAFQLGTTQVTATATDMAGNTASCTFNVIVVDTVGPALLCPSEVKAEATTSEGAVVSYPPALASDAVSQPMITYSAASGTQFPLGTTPVTATAVDAQGSKMSCTFNVVVQDTTPPQITCPGSVSAQATSPEGTMVQFNPATATDAVTAMPTITYSPDQLTLFPLGPTTVIATAADEAGNKASCSFTVTIRDSMAPDLVCPSDVVAEATSPQGAIVTYPAPSVTDVATTMPQIDADHPSGAQFPMGQTKVTVTAIDPAGNQGSCSFMVTVHDTTAPQLTCPADLTVQASSASGATVTYALPTATDAVTANPMVTSDHPSGSTFPQGTTPVTLTASDKAGNQGTCQFKVNVTAPPTTAKSGGCSTTAPAGMSLLLALALGWRRRRTSWYRC